MVRTIKTGLAFVALTGAFLLQAPVHAQDNMKPDSMKQDSMKQDGMKQDDKQHDKMQDDKMKHDDKMMNDGKAKALETGKFHGKVHTTSGRATVYQEADGKLVLRLTNFKTSNGPGVHVMLVGAQDRALGSEVLRVGKECRARGSP